MRANTQAERDKRDARPILTPRQALKNLLAARGEENIITAKHDAYRSLENDK